MTIDKYNEIKALLKNVEKKKSEKESIEKVLSRSNEISHSDTIGIRLEESWCYTPAGTINYDNLITFLNSEISRLDNEVEALMNEFDNIEIVENEETNDGEDEGSDESSSNQESEN